jgi:predicted Zn-dependent peptidase
MTIHTITLSNGFRVIYEKPVSHLPITSFQVFCDVGSIREVDGVRGASHFIEHMCFKGTKSIPKAKDIFRVYDDVGAYFNAVTTKRFTNYMVKCQDIYVHHCLDVLSDMILNSTFPKKEFLKEEQVVIEENIKDEDDPENELDEMIDKILYENTPFSYPVDTLAYHTPLFDYKHIMDFYHQYYHPSQMVLSIVSNIPLKDILRAVEKSHFTISHSRMGKPLPSIREFSIPLPVGGIQYKWKQKPALKSIYLSISFKTCNQYSKDKYVLDFLKNVLSGALSSRLFTVLREDNGLTYRSDINTDYCEVMGEFMIYTQMDSHKLLRNDGIRNDRIRNDGKKNTKTKGEGVLPLIIQMLNDLIRNGITKEELTMFKHNIRGKMLLSQEDLDAQTEYNGTEYLLYNEPDKIVPYSKIYSVYYEPITLEQLHDCIRRYFRKSLAVVGILGSHLPHLSEIQNHCEMLCQ